MIGRGRGFLAIVALLFAVLSGLAVTVVLVGDSLEFSDWPRAPKAGEGDREGGGAVLGTRESGGGSARGRAGDRPPAEVETSIPRRIPADSPRLVPVLALPKPAPGPRAAPRDEFEAPPVVDVPPGERVESSPVPPPLPSPPSPPSPPQPRPTPARPPAVATIVTDRRGRRPVIVLGAGAVSVRGNGPVMFADPDREPIVDLSPVPAVAPGADLIEGGTPTLVLGTGTTYVLGGGPVYVIDPSQLPPLQSLPELPSPPTVVEGSAPTFVFGDMPVFVVGTGAVSVSDTASVVGRASALAAATVEEARVADLPDPGTTLQQSPGPGDDPGVPAPEPTPTPALPAERAPAPDPDPDAQPDPGPTPEPDAPTPAEQVIEPATPGAPAEPPEAVVDAPAAPVAGDAAPAPAP